MLQIRFIFLKSYVGPQEINTVLQFVFTLTLQEYKTNFYSGMKSSMVRATGYYHNFPTHVLNRGKQNYINI